jgi:hypothetical protein
MLPVACRREFYFEKSKDVSLHSRSGGHENRFLQ